MPTDIQTPLESLLLFQELHLTPGDPPPFHTISDTLKTNELLRANDTYAQSRLEPEALQSQYLQLLKEEVRSSDGEQSSQANGSSPRKRKRSTPPLDTVDEAPQYKHLVPKLVNRLYFRFRDHAVKSLEEEEQRCRTLQREIEEIERGEWDARLDHGASSRRDSKGVSSIQTILRHDEEENTSKLAGNTAPVISSAFQNGVEAVARPQEPSPVANGVPTRPTSRDIQRPPSDPRQIRPAGSAEHNPPYLPPPQPVNNGYSIGSPSSDIHRRLPPPNSVQTHTAPSPSSHTTLPPADRSSASPIILPPPPGMLRSSGSPVGPLDTLADMAGHQYRASPVMSTARGNYHSAPQPAHQLPQPRGYMPRGYPYYENQPPYQLPYSPFNQAPLPPAKYPHQPNVPPFPSNVTSPGQGSPYSNLPPYQPPMPPYTPQYSGYNHGHGYYQQPPSQPSYLQGKTPQYSEQPTPVSTVSNRERPPKPSPITTSVSSTKWKKVDTSEGFRHQSPKSPSPGAVSPISPRSPSPPPESLRARGRTSTGQDEQSISHPLNQKLRGRTIRARGTGRRGRGGRATSTVSSTRPGSTTTRTRSQSVTSQVDELISDFPTSTRKIKPEPAAPSTHEDDASTTSHPVDETIRRSNRPRRGTTQSLDQSPITRPPNKRKREDSVVQNPSPSPKTSRPGYILGTRNFSKISAPLLSEISAHKLGNLFAKPLTEREAPGYKDLIYRPQDLRSIKNAINAGGKALIKAAESSGEDASSSNVLIPETPDVVPPLGIVNSTQLEKELMRVFANAVMFNPETPSKRGVGPAFRTRRKTLEYAVIPEEDEGDALNDEEIVKGKQDVSIIRDTREIFEAVQQKVTEWRRAETQSDGGGGLVGRLRGGGSEEVDELAGTGEDVVVGSVEMDLPVEPRGKRRRR